MRTLIFSLLLCCTASLFAQFPLRYIDTVYVAGGVPCPNDSVFIISELVANTSALTDLGSNTMVVGNNITRAANYCQGFLQAFSFVNDTTSLGILPAGTYNFTCDYSTADAAFSCQSLQLYDTKNLSFVVGAAATTITLPGNTNNQVGQSLPLCLGDSLQLLSNASAAFNPQWLNNGVAIPGATDSVLTVNGPGTYALAVDRCNVRDTSGLVTVFQSIPQVTLTLPGNACDNDPGYALSGGAPSGGTWSGPFVMGSNFDALTAPVGNYVITYSYIDSVGCPGAASETLYVAPSPQVSFTAPLPVCQYDPPFALSGGQPSGGVYSGAGVSNGMFDPAAAGPGFHILQYTFTNSDSCSGSASQPITVNPAPAQPTITQVGDTLFSSAATGNQWYNTAGPIPGATGPWFVPPVSGSYYVISNSIQGCNSLPSATVMVIITDLEAGLSQAWTLRLAGARLLVQGTPDTPAELGLYDLQGRLLQRATLRTDAMGAAQAPTGTLAPGIYLVRLRTAAGTTAQKVLVL